MRVEEHIKNFMLDFICNLERVLSLVLTKKRVINFLKHQKISISGQNKPHK